MREAVELALQLRKHLVFSLNAEDVDLVPSTLTLAHNHAAIYNSSSR